MYYRHFTIGIIIRVSLLLVNLIGIAIIFGRADLFFNHIILFIILIGLTFELIRFVNKTNRDLAKWISSIKNSDFTIHFSSGKNNRSFHELHAAFKEIIDSYKQAKIEKEVQFQYLRQIVKHISAGIISLEEEDKITLINQPAMDILKISRYSYWRNIRLANQVFVQQVEQIQEGESKLLEVPVQNEIRRLSVQVNYMILLKKKYKIITFHDIENEINRNEIEAWTKLIRILTHEIMNSVTPIASLTETMLMLIENGAGNIKNTQEINNENLEDLAFSLKTIQKRSDGLLRFVEDYRKLTRIPPPNVEVIHIKDLFRTIGQLMRGEMQKHHITFQMNIHEYNMRIKGDFKLLEQVLINLLTNSLHAVTEARNPHIYLTAYLENNRKVIEVSDNGTGIDVDKLDKIFIPFFSTKANGSGIGLSLSKHIMSLHNGNIKAVSQKGIKTSFYLLFQ